MNGSGLNVVYLQPYVPRYRIPLFNEIDRLLKTTGGSLTVISARPTGAQSLRGDDQRGASWNVEVSSVTLNTPAGRFMYRRGIQDLVRTADARVMELDAGNINA